MVTNSTMTYSRSTLFALLCVFALGQCLPSDRPAADDDVGAIKPTTPMPWPIPKVFNSSTNTLTLDAFSFHFVSKGFNCDILDAAYVRYHKLIFGKPSKSKKSRSLSFSPEESLANLIDSLQVQVDADCNGKIYPDLESDESYDFSLSQSGFKLHANQVWGALRGLETFSQIIYQTFTGQYVVNVTNVQDSPRFAHRAILLDSARHYLKKEVIMLNIEAMAQNKFNVFHWHIVDDQSFPFVSKKFPQMSAKGAYNPITHIYTPSDVQEVIEFARLRGVRVMVEFDTPGHTQSWGKGIPNFLTECYSAGKFNGNYGPVNPIENTTYSFLSEFFEEVASVFPDHYVFLGGDEVSFNCWKTNPSITAFMKQQGFGTNYGKLEQYYLQKLLDLVSSVKKGYIVWQEVIDNGCKLKEDAVVNVWKGTDYKEVAKVTALGYRTILSGCWYLDYISYGQDWRRYYKCDPQAFNGTDAQKELVIGGTACLWGEYVDDTIVTQRLWPRASAAGEKLWSPSEKTTSYVNAEVRLHQHRCRMVKRGIPAEEIEGPGFCEDEY